MLKKWFEITLWKRIMGALVLGVIAGYFWGPGASNIDWMGQIFLRLIRMIVVPLVFVTLVSGVVSLGDPKKLGSLGLKTMGAYMGTTAVAIFIGLSLAALIQPGVGVSLAGVVPNPDVAAGAAPLQTRLLAIIPTNPIQALAEANMLAIIFFALMLGAGILLMGKKAKPIADIFDSGSDVMLKITHLVMEVAPFGVFALIAGVVGTGGIAKLLDIVPLVVTFLLACAIHMAFMHTVIIKYILKLPIGRFFQGIRGAQLVAFSLSSSTGTLPVSMTVAEENLGISQSITSSVLPLGATINMDGSAIYVGVLAVFAAQIFEIEIGFADYLLIAFATTMASIGTAAVPSASLFLLAGVTSVFGISGEQTALIVGFVFAFDRPLDMLRTVVNVTGDLSVSTAVAKWEGELDEDVFRAESVD